MTDVRGSLEYGEVSNMKGSTLTPGSAAAYYLRVGSRGIVGSTGLNGDSGG